MINNFSKCKLTTLSVVFLFIVSLAPVTLNEILQFPENFSITYPFIVMLLFFSGIYLFRFSLNNKFIAGYGYAYSVLILILFAISILNYIRTGEFINLKNFVYLLVYFFSSILSYNVLIGLQRHVKKLDIVFLGLFSVVLILYIKYVILQGVGIRVFSSENLFFKKQEYTVFFSIHIGYVLFRFFHDSIKTIKVLLFSVAYIFLIFIIGMKSLFIVICISLVVLLASQKKLYKLAWLSLFVPLILTVFMLFDLNVNLGALDPFVKYVNGYLISDDEARALDTLLIRIFVFENNLVSIFNDFISLIIGSGRNAVIGLFYYSNVSSYSIEAPSDLESGLLYFLVFFGFLGVVLISILILSSINFNLLSIKKDNMIEDDRKMLVFSYIALVLSLSNFFQDNITALYWLILGLSRCCKMNFSNAVFSNFKAVILAGNK